jgi:ribonucleoside-diphosphate reductase alpha subunit
MDEDSIFYDFPASLREEMLKILPEDVSGVDVYYDTFIQFLTSRSHTDPGYDQMAIGLARELLFKRTASSFTETILRIQQNRDVSGRMKPLLHPEFFSFILHHGDKIDALFAGLVEEVRPFRMTYFGWKTLYRSYLLRTHEGVVERPEHLWFRIALFLHNDNWDRVADTFRLLYGGEAIHATPTLYHAGMVHPQMASCFLMGIGDSVKGIFRAVSHAAEISKYAGGIGINITNIRAKKSYIYGTNGYSNGILPMLRVFNDTSRYIDQCFEGSTLVVSGRGLVPIRDLIPYRDTVLTRDGTLRRVLKKLRHAVREGMVRLTIRGSDGRKASRVMTPGHDMLWHNPHTRETRFESVEKAGLGWQTVFVQPEGNALPGVYRSEAAALGWLCARAVQTDDTTISAALPKNGQMLEDTEALLARCYGDHRIVVNDDDPTQRVAVITGTGADGTVPLKTGVPEEILWASRGITRSFLEGWTEARGAEPPAMLRYRGMEANGEVEAVERVEDGERTLYDLEIEENHNYQTELGLAHNGGGKRKGAFAMYIEPWHSDILEFVMARRNTGSEDERARDLFYGLWICDEFMRRVEADDFWYLMSENDCPGLSRAWGERFDDLYRRYIDAGRYTTKMRARELWNEIIRSQIETGNPYILYKDTCNRMSNQQNLGTIRGSNLCCEIIEYSDENEYAVCNLASISLISCVRERDIGVLDNRLWIVGKKYCLYCELLEGILKKKGVRFEKHDSEDVPEDMRHRLVGKTTYPIVYLDGEDAGGFSEIWRDYLCPEFDFEKLGRLVRSLVINLNVIIDKNHYPLEECRRSNTRHRPIGLGVQGLADVFMAMLEPYDSDASRALNRKIFETMYYHALNASLELARSDGSYESFQGSPLSRGVFHFEQFKKFDPAVLSPEYDWEGLRTEIVRTGVRNSLLIAPMPTASTSQILGNTESFEPLTSNFYLRRTLAGEFYVVNRFLYNIFETAGSWNEFTVQSLVLYKGSVQAIDIPGRIKEVFRTVWEIPAKSLVDMAADRQMFIDQSQSFNIYLAKPDPTILTKIHFYGWRKELKTGCYYLRSRAATSSQSFTIDPEREKEICHACSA